MEIKYYFQIDMVGVGNNILYFLKKILCDGNNILHVLKKYWFGGYRLRSPTEVIFLYIFLFFLKNYSADGYCKRSPAEVIFLYIFKKNIMSRVDIMVSVGNEIASEVGKDKILYFYKYWALWRDKILLCR